ncbi:MAG: sigma-70 family RNA polymerase sigma factor, partial [Bacteroidales bacterium]|nr:sigma-70 family RNA polymerase sigma factor [Bacteroidales bacterium]
SGSVTNSYREDQLFNNNLIFVGINRILNMTDIEFTRVYLDTYKDLCLLALRHVHSVSVAEDVVQDSFCKVLVRRPDIFRLEDTSQIKAYLWKTVRNRSIDWCRRHAGRSTSLEEKMLDTELSFLIDELFAPDGYGAYDFDLLTKTLEDAVSSLPPRAREVFSLRREKELSNKEVAEQLGVSVKAVEKQMTISIKRIKQALINKGIPFIFILFIFLR